MNKLILLCSSHFFMVLKYRNVLENYILVVMQLLCISEGRKEFLTSFCPERTSKRAISITPSLMSSNRSFTSMGGLRWKGEDFRYYKGSPASHPTSLPFKQKHKDWLVPSLHFIRFNINVSFNHYFATIFFNYFNYLTFLAQDCNTRYFLPMEKRPAP